jgi:hypothetical protein
LTHYICIKLKHVFLIFSYHRTYEAVYEIAYIQDVPKMLGKTSR